MSLRSRFFRPEFLRFVCVGGFNTVFGYVLYVLLLYVLTYRTAYTLSYLVGMIASYFLNCRIVFDRKPTFAGLLRFPIVYLIQFVFGLVLLVLFVDRYHLDRRIAAVCVAAFSVPLTFLLSQKLIGPRRPKHAGSAGAGPRVS